MEIKYLNVRQLTKTLSRNYEMNDRIGYLDAVELHEPASRHNTR